MKNKWMMITVVLVLVAALALTGCMKPEEEETTAPEAEETTEAVESADEPEATEAPAYEVSVITVTEDTFDELVRSSEGLILVDFWAEWCGPCRVVGPILEEVSAETGVTIAKVNVDENPNLANEFGISAIPAIYAFVDGEHVDTVLGAASKDVFIAFVNQYK